MVMDQADKLRKMMQQEEKKPEARVITVTSGKGGVGKTSISLNLAIQLAKLGKKVVVFDADFGLANIEVMLGIRPQYNLADMIFRGKELKEIITPSEDGISFISGGSGIQELAVMSREQVLSLTGKLAELDEFADVIIIDTGAGISDSVLEFVVASSEVLLVVTPEPTSIIDAYALLKALNRKEEYSKDATTIKIISNKASNEAEGQSIFEKMSIVADKFLKVPLVYMGAVPMDGQIPSAVMKQKPLSVINPDAAAAKAIRQIAKKLLEMDVTEEKERKGISKLFSDLIKNKRSKR